MKDKKGITLVALVVTIIVLIILAGVSINLILGENGLIKLAKNAIENSILAQDEEKNLLDDAYGSLLVATNDDAEITITMKTLREIIAEEIAKNSSVPTGTIISFSTATPPEGYLKCEGQEVSRSEYKALFDVIGTTYGVGDGSSTFKLPDLRGEFLRGTGTNSHTNQGNGAKVGVHQNATQVPYVWVNEKGTKICSIYNSQDKSLRSRLENSDKTLFNSTELINIAANITESNEEHGSVYTTRPTNTSVLYCIKY